MVCIREDASWREGTVTMEGVAFEPGRYEDFTGYINFHGTEGYVEHATFTLFEDPNDKYGLFRLVGLFSNIRWDDGTWLDGMWSNGIWKNGVWRNGTWISGEWMNGTWKNGVWQTGVWENGTWEGGEWQLGTWKRGAWLSLRPRNRWMVDYFKRIASN